MNDGDSSDDLGEILDEYDERRAEEKRKEEERRRQQQKSAKACREFYRDIAIPVLQELGRKLASHGHATDIDMKHAGPPVSVLSFELEPNALEQGRRTGEYVSGSELKFRGEDRTLRCEIKHKSQRNARRPRGHSVAVSEADEQWVRSQVTHFVEETLRKW